MLIALKLAIEQGDKRKDLLARCNAYIKQLENLERTGDRTPANVLEVRR